MKYKEILRIFDSDIFLPHTVKTHTHTSDILLEFHFYTDFRTNPPLPTLLRPWDQYDSSVWQDEILDTRNIVTPSVHESSMNFYLTAHLLSFPFFEILTARNVCWFYMTRQVPA